MKFSREYQEIKNFVEENFKIILILGVATFLLLCNGIDPFAFHRH